ncbi:MAG TPA: tryptophan 2,3-dioxygenase, partial [Gammaproteobacteria bacterium]|nr:tryptophan 2,3-dioxygenase [Gammaproteobacteria bacterium]
SLDGAFLIQHSNDTLRHYLNEMREYMPPNHRRFIEKLESSSQIRGLINQSAKLKDSYNNCLEQLTNFRSLHLKYAGMYIHQQSQQKNPFGRGGSTIRGTGGTPFMSYLKKHHDETIKHKK